MKGFKFRYESILDLIDKKESNVKNKLRESYNVLHREKHKLNTLVIKDDQYTKIIKEKTSSGCKLMTLRNIQSYRKDLNNNIVLQNNVIFNKEKEIDSIRNELLKISKEKKIMEKLKEKNLEEFKMELKKVEERSIDQLVTYKNSLIHR
ncbi:MAG: flagellar export protein FliJ [Maledivibacter sp.]|jgi:flagellar FliJ protein|nr:flagellar export protein FliJ [Maledivibacter sp.]